ncbi:MAG TPA: metal-binding protein [Oculatellaceae cyanobacterium]|jgi:uncharacterized metal-binding protein
MPSGKTHDWATNLCLLPVFGLSWLWTHADFQSAFLITAGAWVGGYLLSPDLDTRSRPFYRWGCLRFIWWPYQWAFRHRSEWTHGLWFAPWLRLFYLCAVLSLLYFGLVWALQAWLGLPANLSDARRGLLTFVNLHTHQIFLLGVGIWIGGLVHVALDRLVSAFKRRR